MSNVRVLAFDVFGTVVDWRSGVAARARALLEPHGHALDWGAFADRFRKGYQPALEQVRAGLRPFVNLDVLHREVLTTMLAELGLSGLSESACGSLVQAWHELDPWPDAVPGLLRLKTRFTLATLSNAHLALLVHMAKRAQLPWDVILSAELVSAYKPAAASYDSVARFLAVAPEACLMVAAHSSDLDAARARGLGTAYVHRPHELGTHKPRKRPEAGRFDFYAEDLEDLASQLGC